MVDVLEDFLGPATVIANKIKLKSVRSSEHINEKRDGPYCSFGYYRFGNMEPKRITVMLQCFNILKKSVFHYFCVLTFK